MRKLSAILIYSAIVGFIFTAIVNLIHLSDIGSELMIVSSIVLIAGLFISILLAGKSNDNNIIYRGSSTSQIICYLGILLFIAGVLLRKFYIQYSEIIIIAGLILIGVFAIQILIQMITTKRFRVKPPDSIFLLPSELERYTGVYNNQSLNMTITVRISSNGVMPEAQVKGQPAYLLTVIEPDIFNNLQLKLVMVFRPDQ